jgi:acetyl esterase/lipase
MRRLLAPIPALMLLAGCSPVAMLNATAPRAGVEIHTDIAYGPGADHTLDVYTPSSSCPNMPVIVFFFGGGWTDGNRGLYRFVGAALARHGAIVVIPNYRLYPDVRFPAFMDDAAAAVAWTHTHGAAYGGDPDHIFLMGHSAGGHIAALLALDTRYLVAAGVSPGAIAGVIGLAGPYDFLPLRSPTTRAIFGPPSLQHRAQPINFVTRAAPPMLLMTGTADETVDPGNTTRLAARLRQNGVAVEEHHYPNVGHRLLIGALATPLTIFAPVRRDTMRFIAAHHAMPRREDCVTTQGSQS